MVCEDCLVAGDDFGADDLGDGDEIEVVDLGGWVDEMLGDKMHDFLSEGERLHAFDGAVVYGVEVGGGDAEGAEEGMGRFDDGGNPVHAHCAGAKGAGAWGFS